MRMMQSFVDGDDYKSFVAVHGEEKAVDLIADFCRATVCEFDICDKMLDVMKKFRKRFVVEIMDPTYACNAPYPAVSIRVQHVGYHPVMVEFHNAWGRVPATETARFVDGLTGLGMHGIYVGDEIIGRRDLEVETLPNGRLVAFVSRARVDFEAIRDVVIMLQRIGGSSHTIE